MALMQALDDLSARLRGDLVQVDDPDYDEARTLYNAMIDKRPLAIARCVDVADVIAAVAFGRDHDLPIAIRGGGHNGPGLALVDDGLVIDCSAMRGIRVDPEDRCVRVEPGCRWGDVDHATHAFGLATVSGIIANTGVPGLALGGGHGYLSRRYGLTADNLLAADVVLADGRLVHASPEEHPDLFWALRGGGGNFGVVTSLCLRCHAVETVIGGPMFWPIEDLERTMRWYRDWLPRAPRELYAFYLQAEVPPAPPFPEAIHGRKVCGLTWCCTGDQEQAESALAQARAVAQPLFEHVGEMPYPALQSTFDGLYPPGLRWYWKGDFVRALDDAAIAAHGRFSGVPTTHSTMHLYPIDGAVHDVEPEATAWPHRDVTWSMVIAGVSPDPADDDTIRRWARDYWEALHPHSAGAGYVNFLMDEDPGRVRAAYGTNLERLRRVKATYDPENRFRINHNIEPA